MEIFKEGDKSKGICNECGKLVFITFKNTPFKYKEFIIPNLLQGFCDECGESVSIPHQSTLKIKEFTEKLK